MKRVLIFLSIMGLSLSYLYSMEKEIHLKKPETFMPKFVPYTGKKQKEICFEKPAFLSDEDAKNNLQAGALLYRHFLKKKIVLRRRK